MTERVSRKRNFSSVTLPNDKWMALFTGSPERAKSVLMLIEEQVIGQANHDHGAAEAFIVEVDEQQTDLVIKCKECGSVLWQASCTYLQKVTTKTEAIH
jgi:hypothetical protein